MSVAGCWLKTLCSTVSIQDSFLPTMPQDNVEEIVHAMRIDQEAAPDLYAAFGFAPYDNTMLWGNALFLFLSV